MVFKPETNFSDDKHWLVKSSYRVLGPYSKGDIMEMIRKKQLSLLDEIRKPNLRWLSLRDHKDFSEAVRLMQELDAALEGTQSQKTTTASVSRTERIIDDSSGLENTQAEYNRPPASLESAVRKEKIPTQEEAKSNFKDITATKETNLQRHSLDSDTSSKSFGVFNDQKRIQRIEKKSGLFRGIIFAALGISILAFVGQQFFMREKNDKNYQSLVAAALRYKALNLYDKSMDAYRKAKLIKKLDPEVLVKMAPLAMVYDLEINQNRQLLITASQNEDMQNRKTTVESLISLGLSYAKEGDLEKAKEYYQKALSYESFNEAAIINKSLIQLKQNQNQEAYITLGKLNAPKTFKEVYLYVKSMVLIRMSQKRILNEELKSLVIDIENQLQSTSFLQNQLRLAVIRMQQLLGDPASLLKSIEKFLELEPGYSHDLVKNYMLDWSFSNNENIWSLCEEISQNLSSSSLSLSFKAFCTVETERNFESQKWVDQALALNPQNAHALHVEAFVFWNSKKISETMTLIKQNHSRMFPTTKSLLGRLCVDQKDADCVMTNLNFAKASLSSRSQAYSGLASWSVMNNRPSEALQHIRSGLEINSEYKPLLEMRSELESIE